MYSFIELIKNELATRYFYAMRVFLKLCVIYFFLNDCSFVKNVQASQVPQQLIGRSISIDWLEEREQRLPPDEDWHTIQTSRIANIYVSTAGRLFRRERVMLYSSRRRGPRGLITGSGDAEVGSGSEHFETNKLVIISAAKSGGGARQIVVQFDPNYSSCEASVINGKSESSDYYTRRSIINGKDVEFKSIKTSFVRCYVREGNILQ